MNTEVVKIIEAGLKKDHVRVEKYAKLLAENLQGTDDKMLARRILRILGKDGNNALVNKEELITKPIDQDSKLNIAEILAPDNINIDDIVLDEHTQEIIDEFTLGVLMRDEFERNNLHVNNSVLFYGAPGTGKTSLAKYIAKKLNKPLVIARFDSLISALLGNTSKNIRKIFSYANQTPCILFLDEIDAIAKSREDQHEQGELKRVINSLLQNIDDFTENNILIAATNHERMLDSAIWRRFEKVIKLEAPNIESIRLLVKSIFSYCELPFNDEDKKIEVIYKNLIGLTNSEIKKIIQHTIKKKIINKSPNISVEDYLYEIFRYKNDNQFDKKEAVLFFLNQGITQTNTGRFFNISHRQLKTITDAKEKQ